MKAVICAVWQYEQMDREQMLLEVWQSWWRRWASASVAQKAYEAVCRRRPGAGLAAFYLSPFHCSRASMLTGPRERAGHTESFPLASHSFKYPTSSFRVNRGFPWVLGVVHGRWNAVTTGLLVLGLVRVWLKALSHVIGCRWESSTFTSCLPLSCCGTLRCWPCFSSWLWSCSGPSFRPHTMSP